MKKIYLLLIALVCSVSMSWADIEEGTAWKEAKNNPVIYFDNTNANYSNVSVLIGRQYTYGSDVVGSSAYAMTKIQNTNLYYVVNVNFGWFTTFCIVNDTWTDWATRTVSDRAKNDATSYTSAYNTDLNGNKHLFTAADGTKGAALSYQNNPELNYTQKVEVKVLTNGSFVFQQPMVPVLTITGYKFDGSTTAVSAVNQVSESTWYNNETSLARTSQATFTAGNYEGYTFLGWYTQEGKLVSANQEYTFTVTGANYLCAHYAPANNTNALTLGAQGTDGYYATFSSNHAVKFTDATVYKISVDNRTIVKTEITNKEVPANTGVLLFNASASVNYSYINSASAVSDNMLYAGTGETITAPANCKYYKLAYSDGTHTPSTLGFYYGAADGAAYKAKAGGAYLAVPKPADNSDAPAHFSLTDETTAVENVEAAEVVKFMENGQLFIKKNGVVYNAMGQIIK